MRVAYRSLSRSLYGCRSWSEVDCRRSDARLLLPSTEGYRRKRWIDLAFNGKTSVILLGPSSIRAVPSPFITDHAPHHSHKSKVIQL